MPELPEVETTRRGICPHILNQSIKSIRVHQPKLRWPIPTQLKKNIGTAPFTSITRRGKYLLLNNSNGTLMIHLGMSGKLRILKQTSAPKREKHDHVEFIFNHGVIMRYHDPRRFGSILWTKNPDQHKLLMHLGPEPLSKKFNARHLKNIICSRGSAIKQIIMNSKHVVGVGNIYANEALFLAHIHPQTPANKITDEQCKQLSKQIKIVLTKAIAQGGTTLKDFSQADGKPGYFAQQLYVYGRTNQACMKCSNLIVQITQHQRSSFYCPTCQPKSS